MIMYLGFITICFIGLDIISGLLKATFKKKLNSTCLMTGLYHKTAEILSIVLALIMQVALADIVYIGFEIPIYDAICGYIILMEVISVIENICEINPQMLSFFKPYLEKLKDEKDDEKRD